MNGPLPSPPLSGGGAAQPAPVIDKCAEAELSAALARYFKPLNWGDASPSWAWTAGGGISTAGELATYVKALVVWGLGIVCHEARKSRAAARHGLSHPVSNCATSRPS